MTNKMAVSAATLIDDVTAKKATNRMNFITGKILLKYFPMLEKFVPELTKDDVNVEDKIKASTNIKVMVHIPNNVNETIKRQKINQIYDILSK